MPNEACKEFVCAIMAVLADLTLTRERRGRGDRLVAGLAAVMEGEAVGPYEVVPGTPPELVLRWVVGDPDRLKIPREWTLALSTTALTWVTEDWGALTCFPISERRGQLSQILAISGQMEPDHRHMLVAALGVYAHHLWLFDESHHGELSPYDEPMPEKHLEID